MSALEPSAAELLMDPRGVCGACEQEARKALEAQFGAVS